MNKDNEIKKIDENYELIKFEDGNFSLDVNVSPSEDTVWLNKQDLATLFERDRTVISKHIKNILLENELIEESVCAFFALTASDGKIYNVEYYNLDMILAVGYRVKSKRGNSFRRWANSILKQYLLKGHVINESRCLAHSDNIVQMNNVITNINDRLSLVETKLDNINNIDIFKDKIFYNGELFEGYSFIKNLLSNANIRIVIIDSYLDYSVLEMLIGINVPITIYIGDSAHITNKELDLFKTNHNLTVIRTNKYHDRFIIIDDELFTIGSSIKDIGKKISHISKLESVDIDELLSKYN